MRSFSRIVAGALLASSLLVGEAALAQDQKGEPGETAAESRSAAFQAVEGKPAEQVPGGPLLVGAYAFILVALVVYVARLGALHAKNRGELDRLARVLERGHKG